MPLLAGLWRQFRLRPPLPVRNSHRPSHGLVKTYPFGLSPGPGFVTSGRGSLPSWPAPSAEAADSTEAIEFTLPFREWPGPSIRGGSSSKDARGFSVLSERLRRRNAWRMLDVQLLV